MAVVLDSGVSLVDVSEESHIALVCDKRIYDRGSGCEQVYFLVPCVVSL